MPDNTLTKTIEVPKMLYRQGTSEMDADGNVVRLSISSDVPYLRYDWRAGEEYYEVLSHDNGEVDLSRLENGASLLFNHNRDVQLGTITKPEMQGGKCYVEARLSEAPDVESYRIRMKERILKDVSVGYEVSDEGELVGKKDGLPIFKFRWFPHEASMCTIAADITVGLGRTRTEEHPKEGSTKEISIRSKISVANGKEKMHERNSYMNAADISPEQAAADLEKAKKEAATSGVAAYKAKCKKIDDYVGALKNEAWKRSAAKVAEKHKGMDDPDFDAFRTEALDGFNSDVQLDTPEGEQAREISSGRIQVGGTRQQAPMSPGEKFTSEKGFQDYVKNEGRGSFRKDVGGTLLGRSLLTRGQQFRAGFNSTDLAAINVTISQEMISLGVQRLTIMDLLAGGTMSTAGFVYPVENSFDPFAVAADTVAERGLKPEWEPDITTARADAQVIAVMATVPKQFMADFSAFGSWLNNRGDYLLQIKAEQQLLYGNGVGSNIKGITTFTGVQTRAYGTVASETTPDALFRGNTDIETNAYFDPDGFAMHPYDFEQVRLLKDANGQYLGGGPFYAPYGTGQYIKYHTLWGLPCVVTKSVKLGRPIAGAWKMGAQWFLREGLTIETSTSHKDYFQRNLLAVLFEERLALACYRPIAFLEHTGFPGRA